MLSHIFVTKEDAQISVKTGKVKVEWWFEQLATISICVIFGKIDWDQ